MRLLMTFLKHLFPILLKVYGNKYFYTKLSLWILVFLQEMQALFGTKQKDVSLGLDFPVSWRSKTYEYFYDIWGKCIYGYLCFFSRMSHLYSREKFVFQH